MKRYRIPGKCWWSVAVILAAWFPAWASPEPSIGDFGNQSLNPDAAPETEMLGQLAGRWSVRMEIRDQDGYWQPQDEEREWRWYYILDGHAIQDDFITVYKDEHGNVLRRTTGTNIRIFNGQEQRWYMAWIHSDRRRLATFTAVNQKDKVIMRGTNDQGREVKNTFYDIQHGSFEWIQEWTFDDGGSWVPVVRIHATRIE